MTDAITSALELTERELVKSKTRTGSLTQELAIERDNTRKLEIAARTLRRLKQGNAQAPPTSGAKSPTKDEVRPLLKQFLRDNHGMEADAIYKALRKKLGEKGISALGLGLRIKELLAEDWVCEVEPGIHAMRGAEQLPGI